MKNKTVLLIIISIFIFFACNSKVEKVEDSKINEILQENTEGKVDAPITVQDIWKNLPLKQFPVLENTNFDNIKIENELSEKEILLLKLNEIYPKHDKLKYIYTFQAAYKLEFSEKFHSIVVHVLKGDHEVETILVNYSLDEKLIDFKVIAYDETAESQSRINAKIEKNSIVIFDEFYGSEKQVDIKRYHINKYGEINLFSIEFPSNLRPNHPVLLNEIYTDTIQFSSYEDDYDYKLLIGKKNGISVALVYNWEWYSDEKYNFKEDDIIKVTWKMDSIWQAGDSEILDFKETAIEAKTIKKR